MALTKEQILSKATRRYVEHNGVRLQSLTLREYSSWETSRIDWKTGKVSPEKFASSRSRFLAMCIVDESGKRIFQDNEYGLLDELDAEIADLYDVAMKLCGFGESQRDEYEKN